MSGRNSMQDSTSVIRDVQPRAPDAINMGILKDGAAAGLPQTTRIPELDKCVKELERGLGEFESMKGLKGMISVHGQVKECISTLKEAQDHLLEQDLIGKAIATQSSFKDNISQVQE